MPDFKIGCQTITFGEEQSKRFPQVFDEVAAAGYAGVEIGYRHVRLTPARELGAVLTDRGLELAALHIGGNLFDAGQADQERKVLDEVLDYLNVLGTELLMYSGLRYRDDEQFASDLYMLNRAADKCHVYGVKLLYHNHNWEFEDDAFVMEALLDRENSEYLGFCPDIGWVMKGGRDIIELLDAMAAKIGAVHFKDFATNENQCDTVILGTGVAPLAEAAEWIRNTKGMWVIAEQDKADVPPAEAVAKNAEYLRSMFG